MTLHTVKMDQKGRISIPFGLRNLFGLQVGDELVLETDSRELKIIPKRLAMP